MDLTSFNINEVEPMGTFEPLPADWYKCVISAAEQRDTKAMDGSYLMLTIEVIEGSYQGRKIFDRLNLQNKNPVAVDIARRSLASIAKAVGVDPQDSADLIDIPLMVKVAVREARLLLYRQLLWPLWLQMVRVLRLGSDSSIL